MRYLQIFLSILITVCTASAVATEQKEDKQVTLSMKNIDSQLETCRQLVSDLTHAHQKVLIQFDVFAQTLRETYLAGDGLVNQDILRIIDGIAFAAEKHRIQTRKNLEQTPYIIHPMGVANNMMHIGGVRDPDMIIGGLLHDTVEDTQTTFEEIEQRFGIRVAGFVREVTDDKSLPKQVRKLLQIAHAHKKSAGAAQIKLSDKLYNLTDMVQSPPIGWDKERLDAYFQWAKAVVDNLPWVNAPLKGAVDEVIYTYWQSKD